MDVLGGVAPLGHGHHRQVFTRRAIAAGPDTRDAAAPGTSHGDLAALQPEIDATFGGETLLDVVNALDHHDSAFATETLKMLERNCPLSMGATLEMVHRLRGPGGDIRRALETEYRFSARAMEHGDFLEGIRAAIIDKDKSPKWSDDLRGLKPPRVTQMLQPLGKDGLTFGEDAK